MKMIDMNEKVKIELTYQEAENLYNEIFGHVEHVKLFRLNIDLKPIKSTKLIQLKEKLDEYINT